MPLNVFTSMVQDEISEVFSSLRTSSCFFSTSSFKERNGGVVSTMLCICSFHCREILVIEGTSVLSMHICPFCYKMNTLKVAKGAYEVCVGMCLR